MSLVNSQHIVPELGEPEYPLSNKNASAKSDCTEKGSLDAIVFRAASRYLLRGYCLKGFQVIQRRVWQIDELCTVTFRLIRVSLKLSTNSTGRINAIHSYDKLPHSLL